MAADEPLDVPARTLAAVEHAQQAAHRTRQSLELSLARVTAGAGLGAVGVGSFSLLVHAPLVDWARWTGMIAALLLSCSGVVLVWVDVWNTLRSGRRGGQQSPFANNMIRLSRWQRLAFFGFCMAIVVGEQFLLRREWLGDDLYYGIVLWCSRLAVIGAAGFFIYRFARSGLWQYLVLAGGVLATAGLYFVVPPGQQSLWPALSGVAAVAMVAALVAAGSLLVRGRRLAQAYPADDTVETFDPNEVV